MIKKILFLFIFLFLLQMVSMCSRVCSKLAADIQIDKSIKLILQFDINKTIIAEDMITNKDQEYIISHQLAETVVYPWGGGESMSYLDYVEKVLSESKEEDFKRALIRSFPLTLAQSDHPEKENYLKIYEKAIQKMSHLYLIPSFVKLLDALQRENANFRLVLRTFGRDIRAGKVIEAVNTVLKDSPMVPAGRFIGDHLVLSTGEKLTTFKQIDHFIKEGEGHIALEEDGLRWIQDDKKIRSGKKIIIDLADEQALSLFFDDNINSDPLTEYGIAQAVTVEGEALSMKEALYSYLFPVNMLEAILNDDYYIEMLSARLNKKT